jgi:hypothetical protein
VVTILAHRGLDTNTSHNDLSTIRNITLQCITHNSIILRWDCTTPETSSNIILTDSILNNNNSNSNNSNSNSNRHNSSDNSKRQYHRISHQSNQPVQHHLCQVRRSSTMHRMG